MPPNDLTQLGVKLFSKCSGSKIIVFRLTVSTLASMNSNMRLIDVNGAPHVLTDHQVGIMITIGWVTFLAAWLMNLLYYKVHPSSVNFSPKEKMFIYIFGKKYNLRCTFCRTRCCTNGKVTELSNYIIF